MKSTCLLFWGAHGIDSESGGSAPFPPEQPPPVGPPKDASGDAPDGGTPGSDRGCPFAAKTVSREVSDSRAVLRFLRESGRLALRAPIHIVGLSTGAIVAALLRGAEEHLAILLG